MARKIIARTAGGGRQIKKMPDGASWHDPERRAAFLAHMEMTCNVTASAAKAGLSLCGAYEHRHRSPTFRDEWAAALDEGRENLWALLLQHATEALNAPAADDEPEGVSDGSSPTARQSEREPRKATFDPTLAITLLKMHDAAKGAHRGGARRKPRQRLSSDELRAVIFEKLSAKNRELGGDG